MGEIRFDDRVAIVTGSGGGLGRTYALDLGRRGAKVVVNDIGGAADGTGGSASPADQVVAEIAAAGGTAVANYDSVATPDGGASIVQTALDAFGRIDIVVNNAGILRDKTFAKLEPSDLEAVIDVHLKGAFYVSQPAFRAMKEQNYGRFVFATSAAGLFGNFGQSNYGAAKMGLVGLSHVLSVEGRKYGIHANCIAPLARTRMTEGVLGDLVDSLDPSTVTPMVTYLASEACEFTHEIFSIGGGRFARVFVGVAPGWTAASGTPVDAEAVSDHIEQIREPEGYIVPRHVGDELTVIAEALKG